MAVPRTNREINDKVAHFTGVRIACMLAAEKIAAKANAELMRHHKTGEHRVYVETYRVDSHVILTGTAALSLEVGHRSNWAKDGYVEGIHVLKLASSGHF